MSGSGPADDPGVAPTPEQPDEQTRRGAQRLVVMWVCWVVLAIFLVTAGVCAFG